MKDYTCSDTKYDDNTMKEAVKITQNEVAIWGNLIGPSSSNKTYDPKNYQLLRNNCQDFVTDILKEYKSLTRRQQKAHRAMSENLIKRILTLDAAVIALQFFITIPVMKIVLLSIEWLTIITIIAYCLSIITLIGLINFKIIKLRDHSKKITLLLSIIISCLNTIALLFTFNLNILIAIMIYNQIIPGSFT